VYTDTPRGVRPYGRTGAATLAALSVLATGTAVLATPSAAFAAPAATFSRLARNATILRTPIVDKSTALRGPSVKMTSRFARATNSDLTADATLVKKGDQVVFTGKLTFGRDGVGVVSHPVRLESSTSDGSWSTVANGLVGPDGTVSFAVTPPKTATYRLSYGGVRPLGASVSPEQTVTVKLPPPAPVVRTTNTGSTSSSSRWAPAGVSVIGSAGVAASGAGAAVVEAAAAQSGKPYVFGGSGPNAFDCSGLTMFVYAQFGVYLPHLADAQMGYGVAVSAAEAAPGDLIFFVNGGYAGHVGIYAGGGMMYDAPHAGSTVGLHQIYSSGVVFRRIV
jgi:cell wall-associated NlpC family hydrolase